MATFQERFNLLFDESEQSQEEFGARFGASKGQVFNWRSGRGEPDSEMMKKIAKSCNVSVNYLVGQSDIKKEAPVEMTISDALKDNAFLDFIYAKMTSIADDGESVYGKNDPLVKMLRDFKKMSRADQEKFLLSTYSKVIKDKDSFALEKKEITDQSVKMIIEQIQSLPKEIQQAVLDGLTIKK